MIVCCHTEINSNWSSEQLEQKLSLLPDALQEKILLKKDPKEIQLAVCGKLLLIMLLEKLSLNLSLSELRYDSYHRPFFNADFDFNISHAGNRVIWCRYGAGAAYKF